MSILVASMIAIATGAPPAFASNAAPIARAGPDRVVVAGAPVTFDGRASSDADGGILVHRWSFGDGRETSGTVAQHVYRAPGTYVVHLRVHDNGAEPASGFDTVVVTVLPRPNVPPHVQLDGPRTALLGEPVTFSASESRDPDGRIVAIQWRIGGTSRDGPNITHVFHQAGIQLVQLEVVDDRGGTTRTQSRVTILAPQNRPPVADAGPDLLVAPGETVTLDGSQSHDPDGAIAAWDWTLGDGTEAIGPIAQHSYKSPGLYVVRLRVEDTSGRPSARAWDSAVVRVNAPPVAVAGSDRRARASRHLFDAEASHDPDGAITRYVWDFGDGKRAEGRRITHEFPRPGRYTVVLTVTDDSGLSNGSASDELVVIVEPPLVVDAGPAQSATPGEQVVFDVGRDISSDYIAIWHFGDGTRLVGRRVAKTFDEAGRHVVRVALHAAEGGSPLATDETSVAINAAPVARAGPDIRTAPGEDVRLDASASFDRDGEIHRYAWTIDGEVRRSSVPILIRRFDAPGEHVVKLAAIDDSGASNDTATDTVIISVNSAPRASAGGDRIVAARAVVFDASGSSDADDDALTYRWDFGDGTTGEGVRVSHIYAASGRYSVVLEVDDGTGFSNAVSRDRAVVRVNATPTAEAGSNLLVCSGNVVTFDGSGSVDPDGDTLTHTWSFDDGPVLEGVEARRTFEEAGSFAATLKVDDGSGVANATALDRVFVSVDPRPRADAGRDQLVCAGRSHVFDGSGSVDVDGVVDSFRWNFGDGKTADSARPSHAFAEPGRYRISLTIEGDPLPRCDNVDIDWATVNVSPAPSVRIEGPSSAAVGEPITLSGTVTLPNDNAEILAYNWTFSDGTTERGPSVVRRFDGPGSQTVRLSVATTGVRAACATGVAIHSFVINASPEAILEVPEVVAAHSPVRFNGSNSFDSDGMLTAYRISVSDGTRLVGVAPTHIFTEPGQYDVTLEVEDDSGRSNGRARTTRSIEVIAAPKIEIKGPVASCVGQPVTLLAALPGGLARLSEPHFSWELGDGTLSELREVTHIYRTAGSRTVTANFEATTRETLLSDQASRTHIVNGAPVAVAGNDVATCPGFAVDFDGRRSVDADGNPLSATWEFGDGATANGLEALHRYEAPGVYRARLVVDDGVATACSVATDTRLVRVNASPIADAGGDRTAVLVGGQAEIAFDGSASKDPEGRALRHVWSIDGKPAVEGMSATFNFEEPGRYQAVLQVADGTGLPCSVSSDVVEIEILP